MGGSLNVRTGGDPERWCQSLPIMVALQIEGRSVWIRPWLTVLSGHEGFQIPILLLDTDVAQNSKKDRTLTDSLYGATPPSGSNRRSFLDSADYGSCAPWALIYTRST